MQQTPNKHTQPFPLQTLNFLYSREKIWLNPDYQRESVWTLSQKQLLMDSILRGIDIPKIYFRRIDKKSYEYEVVDGQQRLRAIFDYLKDSYKLSSESDKVDGSEIAGKIFSKLTSDLQIKLQNQTLDITILQGYSDDDVEETFLRLQNGTPLNAAEKRRAIAGNVRDVVENLSNHKIFKLCAFSNKRFAFEDAVAKVLHIALHGEITDIKPNSVRNTYSRYKSLNEDNPTVISIKAAFNFISTAFKDQPSPQLKKFSIITVVYLVNYLLENYDISNYKPQFARAYLEFEKKRTQNAELAEDLQDSGFQAYTDAARSDDIANMNYRHDFLLKNIIQAVPELVLKDQRRDFTGEQRFAIFLKNKGVCQKCGVKCLEDNFHADHIIPHSKGGHTKIINGQVLCPGCNLLKGNKM